MPLGFFIIFYCKLSEMATGFIFVEFSDPINQLARKVSKQRYSNIGVFRTDDDETNIFIPKIYGDNDEIANSCKTLRQLESYPLTCSYALYEVSDKKQEFMKAFVSHYKMYERHASLDDLLDLFLGIGSFNGTGVGIANSIIRKMGISLDKSNSSSIDGYDNIIPEDKFDILSVFMSTFRSQIPEGQGDYLLCSHLRNPFLKKTIEKVFTPNKEYRNAFIHRNSKIITGLLDRFISKLSSNSIYNISFSNTVVKSYKDVQEEHDRIKKLLLIALDKIVDANGSLKDLFKSGTITWDKLLSVSDNIKDGADIISLLTNGKLVEREVEPIKPVLSYDVHVSTGAKSTTHICLEGMKDIMSNYDSGELKMGELLIIVMFYFHRMVLNQFMLKIRDQLNQDLLWMIH